MMRTNRFDMIRDGALPPLARRPAATVAALLGQGSRQRPAPMPATLGEALAASMPKTLAEILAEALDGEKR